MFKVIISGSRGFNDDELLERACDAYLVNQKEIEVVCGEARGADTLGKRWAMKRGHRVKSFPANWDKYGNRAGVIRNREMGEYADAAICFWDGKSRGTAHMIQVAEELALPLRLVMYKLIT